MGKLMQMEKQCKETNYRKENPQCEINQKNSLETEEGRAFYEQIEDEALLQILKEKAEEF